MRIGIEFLFAQQGTTQGYDSYLRNLLSGLNNTIKEHEIIVFCNTPFFTENKNKYPRLHLVNCQGKWQNRFSRAVWMSCTLPGLIRNYGIHGMFFPTHFRPIMNLGRVWTTFNVHDLQYRYINSNFGNFQRIIRDFYYRLSLTKSNRIICISEYVKNTVKEQFPKLNSDRLIVIPNPIIFEDENSTSAERNISDLKQSYILTIGKHFPHKNIETLINAYAILINRIDYSGSLIIAGGFTSHTPFLRKLVEDLGITDRVQFLGYVSDAVREDLYRSADAFIFCSLYEGFGMPVIEAMGHRIPVICSDITALPEVTFGLATYYSPPTNAETLAEVLTTVLQQPPSQQRLMDISTQVRQAYDVSKISQKYLALWEELGNHSFTNNQ